MKKERSGVDTLSGGCQEISIWPEGWMLLFSMMDSIKVSILFLHSWFYIHGNMTDVLSSVISELNYLTSLSLAIATPKCRRYANAPTIKSDGIHLCETPEIDTVFFVNNAPCRGP
ncbi:PREDICTED: uncharacterized protein LOC105561909 [Vollenhovia emeryi]|uniref:uncharacterized protein LOC105561909 n=1 Tax=Vollenhovia emeryi TaxID=411798 RepID=UPI0005F3BB52|nr:PREDICTED: uncharacterized protein LOC105561909 [Vollenhovia emeryi]